MDKFDKIILKCYGKLTKIPKETSHRLRRLYGEDCLVAVKKVPVVAGKKQEKLKTIGFREVIFILAKKDLCLLHTTHVPFFLN